MEKLDRIIAIIGFAVTVIGAIIELFIKMKKPNIPAVVPKVIAAVIALSLLVAVIALVDITMKDENGDGGIIQIIISIASPGSIIQNGGGSVTNTSGGEVDLPTGEEVTPPTGEEVTPPTGEVTPPTGEVDTPTGEVTLPTGVEPSIVGADTTQNTTTYVTVTKEWSDWAESLPSYVNSSGYIIKDKTQYRYRDKHETVSNSPTLDGWTCDDETTDLTDFGEWSEWSTEQFSPTDNREVQEKIQYSYRDKESLASDQQNLSGWILDRTEQSYGDYGDWSEWVDYPIYGSDAREVETMEVVDRAEHTAYKYYRYTNGSRFHFCKYLAGSGFYLEDTGWLDEPLQTTAISDGSTKWAHNYPQPGHQNGTGCVCPQVANWEGRFLLLQWQSLLLV